MKLKLSTIIAIFVVGTFALFAFESNEEGKLDVHHAAKAPIYTPMVGHFQYPGTNKWMLAFSMITKNTDIVKIQFDSTSRRKYYINIYTQGTSPAQMEGIDLATWLGRSDHASTYNTGIPTTELKIDGVRGYKLWTFRKDYRKFDHPPKPGMTTEFSYNAEALTKSITFQLGSHPEDTGNAHSGGGLHQPGGGD